MLLFFLFLGRKVQFDDSDLCHNIVVNCSGDLVRDWCFISQIEKDSFKF